MLPPIYRDDTDELARRPGRPIAKNLIDVRSQIIVPEGFSRQYAIAVMKSRNKNPLKRESISHYTDDAVAAALSNQRNKTGQELEFYTDISNPGSYKLAASDKDLQVTPHQARDLPSLLKALLVAKPVLVQGRAQSTDWMFEYQKFDIFIFAIVRDYHALRALNPRASELAVLTRLTQMIDAFLAHQQDMRCDFTDRQCAGPIYDQLRDAISVSGKPSPSPYDPPTKPPGAATQHTVHFPADTRLCKKDAVGLIKCKDRSKCKFEHLDACANCGDPSHRLLKCPTLPAWNAKAGSP